MPVLRPFRGLRYARSPQLGDLVCPPYDVIAPEEQERLSRVDPHNAIHLELGSGSGPERYEAAARALEAWIDDEVLVLDPAECLYVYRQDFMQGSVRRSVAGVIGALQLEPFGGKDVLPHEATMAGPKADRLALLRALPVNVSPIYAIYRGGGAVADFLASVTDRPVAARVVDATGTLHRLWVISAPAEIELLAGAVAAGPLVIADGHHRYETALEFHREREGRAGDHDAIMCFVVDADSEQPAVLPYHRAVTSDRTPAEITAVLERWQPGNGDGHRFRFLVEEGEIEVVVPRAEAAAGLSGHAEEWMGLDVVVLHQIVLPAVLEGAEAEIAFSKDEAEIRLLVSAGGGTFGILMEAVTAPQIVAVAASGERMPQKASYFWPKALTGLVFRPLETRSPSLRSGEARRPGRA